MSRALKADLPSEWYTRASQERSRETFERVLEATKLLMIERPFREISIAEIARAAQTSAPSIYARVKNKQALLAVLFESYAAEKQALVERIFEINRWRNTPISVALQHIFAAMFDDYRANQGLIRAFLEQATEDVRFRDAWSKLGRFIVEKATILVLDHRSEVGHPQPELGVQVGMEIAFSVIAHQIQMHIIDRPEIGYLMSQLNSMMFLYLQISDMPVSTTAAETA